MTDVHLYVHHSSWAPREEVVMNEDSVADAVEEYEDEVNIVRGLD